MLQMIIEIVHILAQVLGTVIFVQFIMSILITFNVINTYNQFVASIWQALTVLTEPFYRPIRKRLPDLGPIDFSPMVVLVLIWIVQEPVLRYLKGFVV
jgi:YggT family protein